MFNMIVYIIVYGIVSMICIKPFVKQTIFLHLDLFYFFKKLRCFQFIDTSS